MDTIKEINTNEQSISWWDGLTIRAKWDLFFKYNPMIADAPSNINLRLGDINKSHIHEIWLSETSGAMP